ncbi:MAG: trypsin-like peptidase domain-containing protein [Lachnospiraceae bacterium]|nr:trypsin-like peptidase domain-containing protein [Lachnospiraceae bacterium]MBR4412676.1 trypsin-like peptidase domain-containing protein [Lachnospiraceae bacterium]MBR5178461.1 trypsin-like peptidase domain-containing protein [Lachnospiraceae bacterium]MBR5916979.1 trypsin-like peptidase domain-containing protein [Lachnospiraceae bacterium]
MSSENKKPNKFLSFLWIVFLGIVFGVCAGVAYTGIALVSNKLVIPAVVGELPAQTTNFTPGPSDPIKPNDKESDFHAQIEEKKEEVIEEVEDIVMANGEYTVAEVAENCMPAIVSINVVGDYDYNGYKYEGESAGSGIIVGQSDNELLIATNYHVVENNKTISINFCDGNDAPATVKGKKVSMDLAVVAVDLSELSDSTLSSIKIAIIGNSDETKVGEGVVAIGNALGYGQSVTAGVVSALDREIITESGEPGNFIQTDAAINPGNSGGALLNMRGELIGINSDKLFGSAVEGMGYAIPINEAEPIIRELMNKQQLVELPEDQQSYFGISAVEINDMLYTNEGALIPKGVYISEVVPGGTADMAGLTRGDIITEFEGDSIVSMAEFKKYLASYAKGSKVHITYERYNGTEYEEFTIEVTLQGK